MLVTSVGRVGLMLVVGPGPEMTHSLLYALQNTVRKCLPGRITQQTHKQKIWSGVFEV